MSAGLVAAVAMALAFAFTNGIHDASDAIATLVITRAASPMAAVILAADELSRTTPGSGIMRGETLAPDFEEIGLECGCEPSRV